jgi:hypothetical protein
MQELWNLFLKFSGLVALFCVAGAAYNLVMAYDARRKARAALFDAERQVMRDKVNRFGVMGAMLLGLTIVFFALALLGATAAPLEEPTPTVTRTTTPRAVGTPTRVGTPTPLPVMGGPTVPPPPATATKAPVAAPTSATPGVGRKTAIVTGSDSFGGLALRKTPNGELIERLPDGTVVELLGETKSEAGYEWQRVRDPKNREGWLANQYLIVNR